MKRKCSLYLAGKYSKMITDQIRKRILEKNKREGTGAKHLQNGG